MIGGSAKAGLVGLAVVVLAWWCLSSQPQAPTQAGDCKGSSRDPYATLGVEVGADQAAVKKAYRKLAMRWHPDKPSGEKCTFAAIANAYDVLTDPVKKDIFDKLGQDGLNRLRDGDPSVQPGYKPPKPKEFIDRFTGFLAYLSSIRGHVQPIVSITAKDSEGNLLASGSALAGGMATFKITLSEPPYDRSFQALTNLKVSDVTHNCGARARFLGMKKVYYLECPHIPGEVVSVRVAAGAFVSRSVQFNVASPTFTLLMA